MLYTKALEAGLDTYLRRCACVDNIRVPPWLSCRIRHVLQPGCFISLLCNCRRSTSTLQASLRTDWLLAEHAKHAADGSPVRQRQREGEEEPRPSVLLRALQVWAMRSPRFLSHRRACKRMLTVTRMCISVSHGSWLGMQQRARAYT